MEEVSLSDRTSPEPLLTGSEVGEILGMTPRNVQRMVGQGLLPRVVLGHRTTRYRPADVNALIERSIDSRRAAA